MSLAILNEIEISDMKDMSLCEPALIKATDSKYHNLNRYSRNKISNELGIKFKLSNDLFNLDKSIWNSVIQSKYNDSDFDFSEQKALILRGSIIEVISSNAFDNSTFEDFLAIVRNNATDSILNSSEILNITFKNNKAILITSLDFKSGWYSLYSGIIYDNTYILFPTPDIETGSFVQFMYQFNESYTDFMSNAVAVSDKDINYLGFDLNENLSLRELYDIIFKDLRCSTELDEDGYLASISGLSTENSNILVNFFNSFGLTFKSLKKLSYLRKIFRTSEISAKTMLQIITNEINSETLNISGYIIAKICNICSTEEFDKKIINEEFSK